MSTTTDFSQHCKLLPTYRYIKNSACKVSIIAKEISELGHNGHQAVKTAILDQINRCLSDTDDNNHEFSSVGHKTLNDIELKHATGSNCLYNYESMIGELDQPFQDLYAELLAGDTACPC